MTSQPAPPDLSRIVAAGAGRIAADRVIRGAKLYDLVTGDLSGGDIAIVGDRIVGTLATYEGETVIDGTGLIAVPGFIDTHFHVESSLLAPLDYDRCVLPHGVTTAIWDPHEIANVLGAEGLQYALDCASATIMDLRVMLSSCVPATHLETAGAALEIRDLLPFRAHPKALGLAEMMNFPGVIHGDPGVLAKLAAFQSGHIDGHSPLLSGQALNAYLAARIRTDHETTGLAEAREKLSKGMAILIREGSVSKDLHALIPLIDIMTAPFLAFCTDDRNPLDVAEEGHLDFMIRTAIAAGRDPLAVYRTATISAARIFGLMDRGLVAPGYRADIVLIDALDTCNVRQVISAGRLVDDALFDARATVQPVGLDSVKAKPVTPAVFQPAPAAEGAEVPVIGVVPGRIITEHLKKTLPSLAGRPACDLVQDVVMVSVVERHGKTGGQPGDGIATGFVHGFGLKHGAIASSVGHDSHNITVVGADPVSMAAAVNRVIAMKGGFAVAVGDRITGELALPIAGLMSGLPFDQVRQKLIPLRKAAKDLGVTLAEPFLQVAFLPLPVIPHLKITDKGLVDVDRFALID
jgi:adenine deaminase